MMARYAPTPLGAREQSWLPARCVPPVMLSVPDTFPPTYRKNGHSAKVVWLPCCTGIDQAQDVCASENSVRPEWRFLSLTLPPPTAHTHAVAARASGGRA